MNIYLVIKNLVVNNVIIVRYLIKKLTKIMIKDSKEILNINVAKSMRFTCTQSRPFA